MLAYAEVIRHLERLDLASIRPEAPLASGVIDLSGSEDPFTILLFVSEILAPFAKHGQAL